MAGYFTFQTINDAANLGHFNFGVWFNFFVNFDEVCVGSPVIIIFSKKVNERAH